MKLSWGGTWLRRAAISSVNITRVLMLFVFNFEYGMSASCSWVLCLWPPCVGCYRDHDRLSCLAARFSSSPIVSPDAFNLTSATALYVRLLWRDDGASARSLCQDCVEINHGNAFAAHRNSGTVRLQNYVKGKTYD